MFSGRRKIDKERPVVRNRLRELSFFNPFLKMFPFDPPETFGFLIFFRGIKKERSEEVG